MNPRFWEGIVCENRRNDSNMNEIGSGNQVLIIYLPQDHEPPHLTQGADLTQLENASGFCRELNQLLNTEIRNTR